MMVKIPTFIVSICYSSWTYKVWSVAWNIRCFFNIYNTYIFVKFLESARKAWD